MRIAAHTLATPEHDLPTALDLFAAMGVDGVEFVQDDDYACGLPTRSTSGSLRSIGKHLTSLGLVAAHVTPYVRSLDALEESTRMDATQALMSAVDAAEGLGAAGVRVLAPRRDAPHVSQRTEEFIGALRQVGRHAAAANVSLNIETKHWSVAHDAEATLRLLRLLDAPSVGILFDPANLIFADEDAARALMDQRPHVRHVHVKDVRRLPSGGLVPTELGTGDVPWNELFAQLRQTHFEGFLSLEYERRWHLEALPPAAVGLPAEIAYLRDHTRRAGTYP